MEQQNAPQQRPLTVSQLIAFNKPVFARFFMYSLALFASTLGVFFLVRSDAVTGAWLAKLIAFLVLG